jgi:hypothetical protein
MIIVEFPDYTGEALFNFEGGNSKWVPIQEVTFNCDCANKCSSRTAFPLVVAKADSVHGLQGVTIGAKKAIKRLRFFHWDKQAEAKWPGIFYVCVSRVETEDDIALDFNISFEDVDSIGKSESWAKQHAEVTRLTEKALKYREELRLQGIGTVEDLKELTLWICDTAEANLEQQREIVEEDIANRIRECIAQWRQSCENL